MLGKPCEIKEVPNRRVWQLGLGATVQEQGVHFKVWAPKRRRVAEWTGISMAGQVVYELHVGTFTPEGTFNAAARELDELRRLGVTLVELMPVAEFPGRWNWGYDGVDLYAPAHVYGDPEALKRFVDTAHAHHGLSVILDVVYNHLGPDGNYLSAYSEDYFTEGRGARVSTQGCRSQ
jgi:1,4-alpha-glucan branching enzyme